MEIRDNNKIESVSPKYPDFMSKEASDKFIETFYDYKTSEELLYKKREEVRILEEEVKEKSALVSKLMEFFDITYGTKEFKAINNKASFAVFTPTDVRRARCD